MFTFRPTPNGIQIEKIFSKFQNCLVIGNIYIVVFLSFVNMCQCPLNFFHLLFVKFVFSINSAVIRCHAGVGSADLGSLYGAIFIKFVCSFGSAPTPGVFLG